MTPMVRVEGLGKRYRLGPRAESYKTIRESIAGAVRGTAAALRGARRAPGEWFWALKGVGFEVMPGEVVGIVGRNGAGKSTLLKLLSRITEPTEGQIDLNGRVGSLLEVGTGFHPELTGLENIYLNGAILGMRRSEIARKLDEIIAFSEVERFIDTPVKRYSSGMQMRLAFSVAAHLEPEILIVDEVLAVGDSAFQNKCLGKMESVAHQGRTVLFVSHNLAVVRQLCSRAILLSKGSVAKAGRVSEVIDAYSHEASPDSEVSFPPRDDTSAYFTRLSIHNADGRKASVIPHSEPFEAELEYVVRETITAQRVWWMLEQADGVHIMGSGDRDALPPLAATREPGTYRVWVRFPAGILNQGRYVYRVAIAAVGGPYCDAKWGPYFEVSDDSDFGAVNSGGERHGVLLLRLDWDEARIA